MNNYLASNLKLGKLPSAAAYFSIIMGLIVLLGWSLNRPILASFSPDWVTMKVNTAIAFVCLGLSLIFFLRAHQAHTFLLLARLLAVFVFLLGVMTLLEYVTNRSFGIDELLFKDPSPYIETAFPGRPGWNATLSFIFSGAALFLLSYRSRKIYFIAQVLAVVPLVLSSMALIGYIYGASVFYNHAQYSQIAFPATVTWIILSIGIILSVPEQGIAFLLTSDTVSGRTVRRLLPACILIPTALGYFKIQADHAKLWSFETGTTIFWLVNLLIIVTIILWNGRNLFDFEERLRSIIETARDAIISSDANGRIIAWNKSAEDMFGYSSAEAVGRPLSIIIPDRFRKAHDEGMKRFNATGVPRVMGKTIEIVGIRKNEIEFPLELSLSFWISRDNKYFTGIIRDITERKKTEEQVRKLNEDLEIRVKDRTERINNQYQIIKILAESQSVSGALKLILENICKNYNWHAGGVWQIDPAQNLLECISIWHVESPQMAEFKAVTLAAKFSVGEGLPGNVWKTKSSQWIQEIASDPNFPRAEAAKKANLQSAMAFPIAVNEKIIGVIEFFSSEQRPYDEELAKMIEAIASQIGLFVEKNNAYENLAIANKELLLSNQELEQFAYIASHDLQEPLRSILNCSELLSIHIKEKLDKDGLEQLNLIQKGALYARALILSLLEYANITTAVYPTEPTDLNIQLKQALSGLKASIEENGAVITQDLLPKLKVNGVQITQLFQNLISNAIKYRSAAVPRIHISAKRKNKSWLFTVKDNGIGIEPQYRERVFKIFTRLHSKSKYPGTGIGLALCKKIVERHGGEIGIEDEQEAGSVFYFTLPANI